MQFGSVPANEIYAIDFSLRTEPAFNKQVLKGTPVKNPAVYIGCAKWEREEWLGKIYPTSTGKNELLTQYASHFNAIELNATHHKLYKESTIQKWLDKIAGKDFKFCPKMYKAVTHSGSLLHKEAVTDEFLHNILAFKDHLGPIFIQLSDTFSPGRKKELFNYLKTLPTGFQFFLELRHPGWFEKAVIRENFLLH